MSEEVCRVVSAVQVPAQCMRSVQVRLWIVLCGWMFISTRSATNDQLSGQCSIGKIERSAIGIFYMSIYSIVSYIV